MSNEARKGKRWRLLVLPGVVVAALLVVVLSMSGGQDMPGVIENPGTILTTATPMVVQTQVPSNVATQALSSTGTSGQEAPKWILVGVVVFILSTVLCSILFSARRVFKVYIGLPNQIAAWKVLNQEIQGNIEERKSTHKRLLLLNDLIPAKYRDKDPG